MSIPIETKWRRLLYWLRRNFPEGAGRKIVVRRVPNKGEAKDLCGWCSRDGDGGFRIFINGNMCFDLTADTLIHEWAHALTWYNDTEFHSDVWGVTYARILRGYIYWNFGRKAKEE